MIDIISIDEAIQRENKIAEENQKIVDTEIIFDDVSLSQLYCDDTEVIEEHLENYKKCAEYHKQLAKWLEELKDYQDKNKIVVSIDIENIDSIKDKIDELSKYTESQYNKAIDDFVNDLKDYFVIPHDVRVIEMKAEQLKEGRKNENYNKEES